ncbi:hypothetical protein MTYP_02187 [Methylophilaceae bacterium]|nr:hypothetical protein MTYP_02187 [Methylophilaceae bacterium]
MAEIRNYTMNFSSGCAMRLTCLGKLASTEVHRSRVQSAFSAEVKKHG